MITLRTRGDHALCARAGCDRSIGTVRVRDDGSFVIRLGQEPEKQWVFAVAPHSRDRAMLVLKRRRHRGSPLTDVQMKANVAEAEPGDDIECPKCNTPQMVPLAR